MGTSSDQPITVSLQKAIDIYSEQRKQALDCHDLGVLSRLAQDRHAADGFDKLKLATQHEANAVLTACIEADHLSRTFKQHLASANRELARVDRDEKAAAQLRKLVDRIVREQTTSSATDRLSAKIVEPDANIAAMQHGLLLIADHIAAHRRVAIESGPRLGATRKAHMKVAPQNAAIGWLAEAVQRVTGGPNYEAVADLAEVILEIEVSLDRVRSCLRARDRDWRLPINLDPEVRQHRRVRPLKKQPNAPE